MENPAFGDPDGGRGHTEFGGEGEDVAYGVAVSGKTVYISGQTTSTRFPVVRPFQATPGGGGDSFVTRLGDPRVYLR